MAVMRKEAAATILTAPNTYAAEKQGLKSFSIIPRTRHPPTDHDQRHDEKIYP